MEVNISDEVLNYGYNAIVKEIERQLLLETPPVVVAPEDIGLINAIYNTRIQNLVGRINSAYASASYFNRVDLEVSDYNNGWLYCLKKIVSSTETEF